MDSGITANDPEYLKFCDHIIKLIKNYGTDDIIRMIKRGLHDHNPSFKKQVEDVLEEVSTGVLSYDSLRGLYENRGFRDFFERYSHRL